MAPTYVALDIETTGLDPEADEITEVAAVKFDEDRVLDTFHTLLNPRREVPYRIERLTGISSDSLRDAPSFAAIASDLAAFLGALPVVGQNLAFDLSFLARRGVPAAGPSYDTYELARLLLPQLPDYSLRRLAQHLGVEFRVRHRALADAEAARQVFLALRTQLAARPLSILSELERLAEPAGSGLCDLFRELVEAGGRGERPGAGPARAVEEPTDAVLSRPNDGAQPLSPVEERRPVDPHEVEALLAALTALPGFERRPEQAAMAGAVADALSSSEHLIVEAGTGVGKSLAYLLPAACFALRNSERVVISTNTIGLQDQLLGQDVPILRRALKGWSPGGNGPAELRVAQLKGRRNYLCLLRWAALRRSQGLSPAEAKLLSRILLWLPVTETGDRAELSLTQDEEGPWGRLSAQNEDCLASQCRYVREGTCLLLRARKRAESAHLLIVNHALLLSDVAVGGRLLPEYSHLVVDEAQHLEDEATERFGFQVSDGDLAGLLDRLHQRAGRRRAGPALRGESGLAVTLARAVRPSSSALGRGEFAARSQALAGAVERARDRLTPFFDQVRDFIGQHAEGGGDYDQRLLLARAQRAQPDWSEVEVAWHHLDLALAGLLQMLAQLLEALEAPSGREEEVLDQDALTAEVSEVLTAGQAIREGMMAIVSGGDPERICWLGLSSASGRVSLNAAPLQVADLLRRELFESKESVVLTSATLSAQGEFHYLRQRVGLDSDVAGRELLLGSPFDYERSTLLLLPLEMPEPSQREYSSALERTVLDLCRASKGRALVLFTSYAALRGAYGAVKPALEREGILVLGHGIDGTPRQLLAALRENPRTVVMGTATFWEGVDVVGEALSLLVIARLPFTVPTDPVFKARSYLFDEPFMEYALPQAVLRFRQGFGRLIRRKTDRGVVAILDGRVRSRNYGSAFLRSLPPCTTRDAALRQMASEVEAWLGAN